MRRVECRNAYADQRDAGAIFRDVRARATVRRGHLIERALAGHSRFSEHKRIRRAQPGNFLDTPTRANQLQFNELAQRSERPAGRAVVWGYMPSQAVAILGPLVKRREMHPLQSGTNEPLGQ